MIAAGASSGGPRAGGRLRHTKASRLVRHARQWSSPLILLAAALLTACRVQGGDSQAPTDWAGPVGSLPPGVPEPPYAEFPPFSWVPPDSPAAPGPPSEQPLPLESPSFVVRDSPAAHTPPDLPTDRRLPLAPSFIIVAPDVPSSPMHHHHDGPPPEMGHPPAYHPVVPPAAPPYYYPWRLPPAYPPAYPTYPSPSYPTYPPPSYLTYPPPAYPTYPHHPAVPTYSPTYPSGSYHPPHPPKPDMYQVRLVGGQGPSSGRVEIWNGTVWGTVCDDSFTKPEAQVVCRELGYDNGVSIPYFGGGTGPILMDEVDCYVEPTPVRLYQCDFKGWGVSDCDHSEDVGVKCWRDGELEPTSLDEWWAPPPLYFY